MDSNPTPKRHIRHLRFTAPTTASVKLVTRVQRRSTDNPLYKSVAAIQLPSESKDADTSGLRTFVLEVIKHRLVLRGVPADHLTERDMTWCLPRAGDSEQLWRNFLEDPLSTSEAELRILLRLQESDAYAEAPPKNTTLFYIRTHIFTRDEVLDVLQAMLDEGYEYFTQLYVWLDIFQDMEPDAKVNSRYGGQTTQQPWLRHYQDFMGQGSSFGKRFVQIAADLYPEVIANTKVYVVSDATIDFKIVPSMLDIREQIVIALCGDSALNVEKGGVQHNFSPLQEDIDLFLQLGTETAPLLLSKMTPCSDTVKQQLRVYAEKISQYANDHCDTTGSDRIPYSQEMEDAVFQELLPATMSNGYTPLLTLSDDKPVQWAEDPKPFWQEKLKTADLSQTVVSHLGSWEQGSSALDHTLAQRLAEQHCLPFTDVYPWTRKDDGDWEWVVQHLRGFLKIANPVVVSTHGKVVSSLALSSFQHAFGMAKGTNIIDVAGTLHIRCFDLDDEDNTSMIIIPTLHAGAFGHAGTLSELTGRCFVFAQAVIWLTTSEALRTRADGMTKKQFCVLIKRKVDAVIAPDTPFGQQFAKLRAEFLSTWSMSRMKLLTGKKRKLAAGARKDRAARRKANPLFKQLTDPLAGKTSALALSATTSDSPFKVVFNMGEHGTRLQSRFHSWRVAKTELDLIILCGFATTDPQSPERVAEISDLLQKCISAAGIDPTSDAIQATPEYDVWLKTDQGSSYYFAVAGIEQQAAELPNLLRCHIPNATPNRDHPKWMDDAKVMGASSTTLQDWVGSVAAEATGSITAALKANWWKHFKDMDPDTYAVSVKKPFKAPPLPVVFDKVSDIDGSEVEIVPQKERNARLRYGLQWKDDSGKTITVDNVLLPYKELIPSGKDQEKRFIFFVPEGIDIRNEKGTSIATTPEKRISVPLAAVYFALIGNPQREAFIQLWEEITGCLADAVFFVPQVEPSVQDTGYIPASFFATERQAPLLIISNKNSKAFTEMNELLPHQPGDATWLMNEFLKEDFPNGGDVHLGSPLQFPNEDTVWDKLARFCARKKYRKHPHIRDLEALAGGARLGNIEKSFTNATMKVIVEHLRDVTKTKVANSKVTEHVIKNLPRAEADVLVISSNIAAGITDPTVTIPDLVSDELADDAAYVTEGDELRGSASGEGGTEAGVGGDAGDEGKMDIDRDSYAVDDEALGDQGVADRSDRRPLKRRKAVRYDD
ncbi:hypothetical protein LTR17_017590 [Elasticomyces elasticus]|nr:hypothetical protein LTR17_017590 [Elasticomyces elasticus]